MNSYDIYNQAIAMDKPIVDQMVADINTALETNVQNNVNVFDFDIKPYLSALPGTQSNRIIDQVLRTVRNEGISIQIKIADYSGQNNDPYSYRPYATPYFNGLTTSNYYDSFTIRWWTRNSAEYMKTYV